MNGPRPRFFCTIIACERGEGSALESSESSQNRIRVILDFRVSFAFIFLFGIFCDSELLL